MLINRNGIIDDNIKSSFNFPSFAPAGKAISPLLFASASDTFTLRFGKDGNKAEKPTRTPPASKEPSAGMKAFGELLDALAGKDDKLPEWLTGSKTED